ncbi:PIH1 domain containing 1 (Silurana) [Caligus rogercresseyi]|uniref:PIH1 domain containing 1 (Silurana) n=1 Tax=Caligus rogercresseyi TaxID=217165 RepID=A0A7T8GWU3_CALRO|nr:PIH1 domain containing 1 (Silurana) [Caligus rogercresseyi]
MSSNNRSGTCFQPMKLEVDDSILARNLSIIQNNDADLLSQPKRLPLSTTPSLLPDSYEGSSIETQNVGGRKVFINLCLVHEIPPAPHISEQELISVIEEDNYESTYREKDKSSEPCLVSDVAINAPWFHEVVHGSPVFTAFLINILKKKNYHGKLSRHRIQKREKKIHEITDEHTKSSNDAQKPKALPGTKKKPSAFKMYKVEGNLLLAEIHLPGIVSSNEISLDLGEDRIKLESNRSFSSSNYALDVFLPLFISPDNVLAEYHPKTSLLKISMPILKK